MHTTMRNNEAACVCLCMCVSACVCVRRELGARETFSCYHLSIEFSTGFPTESGGAEPAFLPLWGSCGLSYEPKLNPHLYNMIIQ